MDGHVSRLFPGIVKLVARNKKGSHESEGLEIAKGAETRFRQIRPAVVLRALTKIERMCIRCLRPHQGCGLVTVACPASETRIDSWERWNEVS